MPTSPYVPLVELTRGPIVESVHMGAAALVDSSGKLLASLGDPNLVTYMRSSSKPIQVLPLLEQGGTEAYHFSDKEVALMCASHSGTDEHVETVRTLQARIGVSESDLMCGTHPVSHAPTAEAMRARGEEPTPVRHNCSGKHTGFLAYALLRGESKLDYLNPQHPIQQTILKTFAEMTEMPVDQIAIGVDGCSAPVFGIPLVHAALGFARLCQPDGLPEARARACRQVTRAMPTHPFMVAGPGRFDTIAMQLGAGKIICKAGAEGYQAIGLMPGALGPGSPALGIAFKVSDGDLESRARPVAAIEILRQLGILTEAQIAEHMSHLAARPVLNWRKLEVGQMRPAFQLNLAR